MAGPGARPAIALLQQQQLLFLLDLLLDLQLKRDARRRASQPTERAPRRTASGVWACRCKALAGALEAARRLNSINAVVHAAGVSSSATR